MNPKQPIIIAVVALLLIGGGFYLWSNKDGGNEEMGAMQKTDSEMMMAENKEGASMEQTEINDTRETSESAMMMTGEGAMMEVMETDQKLGSYETYNKDKLALAEAGKVVLFFRASWCPTCRGLDADIKANLDQIPQGVTILDIDYDTNVDLRQKYGVTYQHTFVQVDSSGQQLAKWSSSPTLSELVSNIK